MSKNHIAEQVQVETVVVGTVLGLSGLSLIAAFYALAAKKRAGFVYAYIYRFGFTFPVWAIVSFIIFKMKVPTYGLYFMMDRPPPRWTA
jgi:hypothetical protein